MWPFKNKCCRDEDFEFFEINGTKYKRCKKCKKEYQYTQTWTWLKVNDGTIDKKLNP